MLEKTTKVMLSLLIVLGWSKKKKFTFNDATVLYIFFFFHSGEVVFTSSKMFMGKASVIGDKGGKISYLTDEKIPY